MNVYPFDTITVNEREVSIQQIIKGDANPQSDFESDVFNFITQWLTGVSEFVQQTSGSTGNPKAISITRDQMIASAKMTEKALGLKRGYYALLCLNPAYIAGKMMIVRSFVTGMKIIAVTPSANPFLSLNESQQIDFAALVPYQLHEVLQSAQLDFFNTVSTIIVGGASLNTDVEVKLNDFSSRFYATYGMTETVSHIALKKLNGPDASSSFKILDGVRIQLDDRGCLVVKESPVSTTEIITNDLVEIVDAYTFKWVGRYDNVINSGGLKIIPEKLEARLEYIFRRLALHKRFFVGSVPDVRLGNKVVLVIEGQLKHDTANMLKSEMALEMTKHEVPKEILYRDEFVLTENGKINRKQTLNLT